MNARVYGLLLSFYPADLRNDFGAEMTEVFLEDLEDSRRRGGWMGTARVWWRSVREFCCIASPEVISRREIAVPLVMYVLQAIYLAAIIFLTQRNPHADIPRSAGGTLVLIFGASAIPALIARVALLIGDGSVPVPLSLRP
jgi:hypothetical protein